MRERGYVDGLLNTSQAARLLGVRPRTLEHWRAVRRGPTYAKIGRGVRYSRAALQSFIAENEHLSPSDLEALSRTLGLRY